LVGLAPQLKLEVVVPCIYVQNNRRRNPGYPSADPGCLAVSKALKSRLLPSSFLLSLFELTVGFRRIDTKEEELKEKDKIGE
jgi:hypothetical protein